MLQLLPARRMILSPSSSRLMLQVRSASIRHQRRQFSFSFAGARTLDEIIKKDMLENKTAAEVSDIWYSYHEARDNVHGIILSGSDGKTVLSRAAKCPFFVQPIFRDDGFFMLMSQFQSPSYFLLAFLEDYKMDPAAAQALMTFSVFDDYASSLDLTLVRCDVINKGIEDDEGRKVTNALLDAYRNDEEFADVKAFNKQPDTFDVDDYVARQNQKWKAEASDTTATTTTSSE